MKRYTIPFVILLITANRSTYGNTFANFLNDDFFEDQIQYLQQMQEEMRKVAQTTQRAGDLKPFKVDILEQATDNNVVISITNIEADKFDASINDDNDQLTISTPNEKIKLYFDADYRTLGVEVTQEKTAHAEKGGATADAAKSEKDKNATLSTPARQTYHQFCSTRSERMLHSAINLEQLPPISYDKKNKVLTITIPKAVEKKSAGRAVPVNIIEPKDE